MAATVILVDDTDTSRIKYDVPGSWSVEDSGLSRNLTIHAQTSGDRFTFAFNGTVVSVYGTVPANSASNPINCAIQDDHGIAEPPTPMTANAATYNFLYCQFTGLSDDQEHNLILVSGNEAGSPFNLDYILYEIPKDSSSSVVPAGSLANVIVDDSRSDLVQYEGSWSVTSTGSDYNSTVHGTSSQGATATFNFRGVGAQVYGTLNPGDDCSSTTSYVVDNGPVKFCSNNPQLDGAPATQVQLFDSGVLEDKDHTLLIKLEKDAQYWLDFVVYTTSPPSGTLEPQPAITPQPSTSPHSPAMIPGSKVIPSSDHLSLNASTTRNQDPSNHAAQPSLPSTPSNTPPKNNNASHTGRNAIIAVAAVVACLCALFFVLLFLFCRRTKQDPQKGTLPLGSNDSLPQLCDRQQSASVPGEAQVLLTPNRRARSAVGSASVGEGSSYGPPPDYSSRRSDFG